MGKRYCCIGLGFKAMFVLMGLAIFGYDFVSAEKNLGEAKKKNNLKRVPEKFILSEDGDVIDCVDIYKQPAFDHPALKNHTIQMEPSFDPRMEAEEERNEHSSTTVITQIWRNRGKCPKGTIPIRRNRHKEVSGTNSAEAFIRKKPVSLPNGSGTDIHLLQQNHSKAILITLGYSYSGVKGDIVVWNPYVESNDEYSTAQVSLQSGPHDDFETVEAGWMADGSRKTGCFDLTCPGFIQTSSEIALGAAIFPISVSYRLPYQIILYIFQDVETGNWWLQYGEKINIGYWPRTLFGTLYYHAESAEWGGEVYSGRLERSPHTATAMGNGNFPDYIFGNCGSVKRMRIRDNSLTLKKPEWSYNHVDQYRCYDGDYVDDYIDDPEFYYGGPGRNALCP